MLIGIDANEANLTKNRVGINEYAFQLIQALYELDTLDHFQIYLKSPPQDDLPKPRSNWQYRIIPFPKFWTQTRLPWDLYTHTPRPDVFFSATHYAPRFSPVPSVVSIMDLGFISAKDQFTTKDFNQLSSWTAYSVKSAKKVIAISEFTRKEIIRIYHKDPRDVHAIPLSFNPKLKSLGTNPKLLPKLGIKKPYILFISSLKPSKNVLGLINAYHKGNFSEQLVIAGKKAWIYEEIFNLVSELNLKEKVIFTGFVTEEQKATLLKQAKVFIMPSFYEGFSITPLESMSCGTPVVVSDIPSQREVVGDAGIFIDPYSQDSMIDGLREAMGPKHQLLIKSGQDRVKLFSWEKTAQQTLEVIHHASKS